MKRTRILGGFSLVEMMLLLLITSLMLASAVTVISKKHVKVPKIAMHGAYMCYYKNGVLHEEKYVGAGLRKKILDRDVTECRFQPPDRSSYMHIQAVGGGGGGGDSGYKGGNLQRFESKTEVISPFGITENLLKLKGISTNELRTIGGNLYAYANASGELGDAGDGGDLYYIQQDCGDGGDCLVHRDWQYTGNSERECKCTSGYEYSRTETWNYWYDAKDYCYSTYSCDSSYTCTGYETLYKYNSACDSDSSYTCQSRNYSYCYSKASCSGKTMSSCYSKDKDGNCTYGRYDTGCSYCTKQGRCNSGYKWVTRYSTCTNEFNVPVGAYCSETSLQNLTVQTQDKFAENTGAQAPYRIKTTEPQLTEANAYKERIVIRDQQNVHTICNYGNPTKFTGVRDGIFGAFADNDGVSVNCTTADIMAAFGEDIFPLGAGQTSSAEVVEKSVSSVYDVTGATKQARFPYFDRTEELGQDAAYGTSCVNTYNGNCKTSQVNNSNYYNPMTGTTYRTQKPLYTNCSIKNDFTRTTGTQGCSGKNTYGSVSIGSKSYYITRRCDCVQANPKSSGSECMYNYGQITDKSKRCQYIPAMAPGGTAGRGKQCRTNDVNAGVNLTYVGNSSVVPGIRGSDKNCTGAGFKPLYTEAEWNRQPSCYAENGTDSQGSARVELGGNWCEANVKAPGKGQGARKKTTGATTAEAGKSAPYDGGNGDGTVAGSGYTTAGGCGANHVGYCLQAKGNNGAVRENGKYTYKYTWNTNYLQYGEGGKAGAYRTMIIRSFKDRDIAITVGRGGAGGAEGTGNNGENGGDTAVGDILVAEGGDGGLGGRVTPTEQLPYWYEGGDFIKGENGTEGEVPNVANFKANVMNLVLPLDNSILGQWLVASGVGGNGGGSRNNCWASEWERFFEGKQVSEATGGLKLDDADLKNHGCRKGQYWSATPVATDGTPGAVLIRW